MGRVSKTEEGREGREGRKGVGGLREIAERCGIRTGTMIDVF